MHSAKSYFNCVCLANCILFVFYVTGLHVVRIKLNNIYKRSSKVLILISPPSYEKIIHFGENK